MRDVTGALACLGLWGPRARDILGSVTTADLSNDAFPYLTAREIVAGDAPCLAARVTYVGELGWELYPAPSSPLRSGTRWWRPGVRTASCPPGTGRSTRSVWKRATASGDRHHARGHPVRGRPRVRGRARQGEDFIGREAVELRERRRPRRLRCLVLSDPRGCLGSEPVFFDGEIVARVTSGGIGYPVGTSIAFAYLPGTGPRIGTPLAVDVFGERVSPRSWPSRCGIPGGERIARSTARSPWSRAPAGGIGARPRFGVRRCRRSSRRGGATRGAAGRWSRRSALPAVRRSRSSST